MTAFEKWWAETYGPELADGGMENFAWGAWNAALQAWIDTPIPDACLGIRGHCEHENRGECYIALARSLMANPEERGAALGEKPR